MMNFLFNHTPLFYWSQSLWRDEAFSVWIAQDGILEAIRRTSGDFNPPLYYILLSLWMQIFGKSEIALRGMSLCIFLLFMVVTYKFALKIFSSVAHAYITTLLMALNPMLLYFAFELRMYSLLVLFTTLSMYFLYTANWRMYIVATILGMYTQPFMAFVIIAQTFFLLLNKNFKQIVINGSVLLLLYLPWMSTLLSQFKSSGPMWMYPVDLTSFLSALGNVFMGYEGTPGNLWPVMTLVSLCIASITIWLLLIKNKDTFVHLVTVWTFLPLLLVLLISLIKPIYVHRYVIFTTVGEVFLISLWLYNIKSKQIKKVGTVTLIGLLLYTNIFVTSFHKKIDIRPAFEQIRSMSKTDDVFYAASPLVFFETLYYRPQNMPVFLYNPQMQMPPRYVGSIGMPRNLWAKDYPLYPKRAFVLREDGSFIIATNL